MGLAAAARKRFGGPIFLFGDTNGQDRDALPPSVERIARPFRFADLLLRLRAGGDAAGDVVIGARRFRPGGFDLLDEKGRRLPLTEKEAAILSRLVEADGEIVTKEILLRDIWGYRPDVTTRTLEVHLSRLRRKIATTPGARWLLTEKTGYRLIFRRAEGGTAKAGF
nr:winged helix-turn-helix domain-containing protein [Methylosinus sp. Sm6]